MSAAPCSSLVTPGASKASDLKAAGVKLFQSQDIAGAAAKWTAALDALDEPHKDEALRTSLLLNLSLAAFLTQDFDTSACRASEVIDNFDVQQADVKDLAKAYARRGAARRRISEFYKAYDDIRSALLLAPNDAGILKELQGAREVTATTPAGARIRSRLDTCCRLRRRRSRSTTAR